MVSIDKTWGDYLEFGATTAATAAPFLLRSNPAGWTALGAASVIGGAVSAGITYYRTGSFDEAMYAGGSTFLGTLVGGAVMSKVLPAAGGLFGPKAGTASKETLDAAAAAAAVEAKALTASADEMAAGAKDMAAARVRMEAKEKAIGDATAAKSQAAGQQMRAEGAKEAAEKAPQTFWGIPAATNGGDKSRWPWLTGAVIGSNVGHYLGYPASLSKVPVKEVVGLSRPGMNRLKIPDQGHPAFPEELRFSADLDRYLAGEPVV